MIDEALPDECDRLEPPVGVLGEPGTTLPWYMLHPSAPEKSMPMSRASSDAVRPHVLVRCRVTVEMVDTEEERVRRPPLPAQGNSLEYRIAHELKPNHGGSWFGAAV